MATRTDLTAMGTTTITITIMTMGTSTAKVAITIMATIMTKKSRAVVRIVFCRELKDGRADRPSLRKVMQDKGKPGESRIAAYLRAAPMVAAQSDVMSPAVKAISKCGISMNSSHSSSSADNGFEIPGYDD